MPCDHIRSESFVALRQNDGVQEYCRLCDACCLEVIRRALKHYVSDSESKYVIRLLEQFLAFGVSLVKRFRHTWELGTLTGKYVCFFHNTQK